MNSNFQKHLMTKYPELFGFVGKDSKYSISLFGIETSGDGWNTLIETLCKAIASHIKYNKAPQVHVTQIKEKFGTLRFYYDGGDEYISGMVAFAENVSGSICEVCGGPAKLRDTGWLVTLCDKHYEDKYGVPDGKTNRFEVNKMEETKERKGWICPVCNKVMSPDVTTCDCGKATNEDTTKDTKVLLNE